MGFPSGGSFFCTIIDVLNLFFISLQENQHIGVTSEKLLANQLLQALHLLADRGLGTTHCGGGGSEGVQISDCYKGAQQIEIEVEYRTCCINHLSSLTGG